ncbi:hypothetical protein UACE39S_01302 [Ureibacillus acetophenoni]
MDRWLQDIKVIVFDLDGTLYQDYRFLGRYVYKMLVNTHSKEEIEQYIEYAYRFLEGSQQVKLGFFYDQNFTFYEHDYLKPTNAYDWQGNKQEIKEVNGDLTYVGDPWSIATFIGRKEKISSETMKQAFLEVRSEMLHSDEYISKNEKLADTLRGLKQYKVLMTNTIEPSGKEFVDYLLLDDCFDEYHYDGKKPLGIQKIIKGLFNKGYKGEEILSIGDNPFNELHPVKQVGGHTCFISPYEIADNTEWSKRVHTIDDLDEFLSLFNNNKVFEKMEVSQ